MGLCASSEAVSATNPVATGPPVGLSPASRDSSPASTAPPLTPEAVLAKYTVLKDRLGSGATSDVFRGVRKSDSLQVAVKVLDKLTKDPQRQENLLEDIEGARVEADLMKELAGCAHVATVHDFVETGSKIHTFMELVPGGELYDQLRADDDSGSYNEQEARDHFKQMLKGIAAMHERNIVHRDIKPENILMTEPNRSADLKIVDFGFAARVPERGQLYERLGTPKYVAPEVWAADDRRGRGYGVSADIYAFGIILHQMLTGQEPFEYLKQRWEDAHPAAADVAPDDDRAHEFAEWCCRHHEVPPFTDTLEAGDARISDAARDMVRRLLLRKPAARLSASDALSHEWFHVAARTDPLTEAAEGIRKFQARKRMRKAMKAVLFTARVQGVLGRLRKAASSATVDGAGEAAAAAAPATPEASVSAVGPPTESASSEAEEEAGEEAEEEAGEEAEEEAEQKAVEEAEEAEEAVKEAVEEEADEEAEQQ